MDDDTVTQAVTTDPPKTPSKRDRARFLTSKIKSDVKGLLDRDSESSSSPDTGAIPDIFEDAAFNPQKVPDASPHDRESIARRLHRGIHGAAVMVKNPKRALRSKYTRNVAANLTGEPGGYVRKFDEDLVDAHDSLARANARAASRSGLLFSDSGSDPLEADHDKDSTERDVEHARARLRRVEDQRNSMRSAWILGRHVKRAKVVRPMAHRPQRSEYEDDLPGTNTKKVRWELYLAHLILWHTRDLTDRYIDDIDQPPFDLKDFSLAIERFAVVSAAWQSFLVDVRDVYLWRTPRRTARFLIIYCVLWYFQHIMTAAIAWIIFVTVRNKFLPTTVESVREKVIRAKDQHSKAQAWGELIQRHGEHGWIEPLIDELGPIVQLHLGDFSEFLEMLESFYRWERPRRTATTLFLLVLCLSTSALTSAAVCVRITQLGLGLMFFLAFPIAARFPKYRKLVSPVYWILWDVPSMADNSITQLQQKMASRETDLLCNSLHPDDIDAPRHAADMETNDQSDSTIDPNEADFVKSARSSKHNGLARLRKREQFEFQAVSTTTHVDGRLVVNHRGLWYHDKTGKSFYAYARLIEIRKVDLSKIDFTDTSTRAKLARRVEKYTALRFLPSGLEFVFLPSCEVSPDATELASETRVHANEYERMTLTVSEEDRDKVFSLVIGWSNLKWQPHFSMNTTTRLTSGSDHPAREGKGNKHLDEAIKSFVE